MAARNQTTLDESPTPSPTASPTPSPTPSPIVADDTAGEEALAAFYGQQVTWTDCGGGYQCTRVAAPLDWDEPDAGAIEIAVKRLPASGSADRRIGSLLINPGGPGNSGVDQLASIVNRVIGSDVRAAYDLVSFDPRGVGQSSAVTCGDDAGLIDAYFTYDADIDNQADLDRARTRVRLFGRACLAATGRLLGEVDTVSTAHDLDLLRAVLGDAQLHYLGFSYGTYLGATYADLYPQNVSRMVLDGALDPSQSLDDLLIGQAVGFENALRAYVTDCQARSSCPLTGGVDAGLAQVADLVQRIGESPIPAGDGKQLNDMLAFYGIVMNLYSQNSWPNLTASLNEAMHSGTGTRLLADANRYLDRTPDGGYQDNANLARTAINCLDYPAVLRDYDEMVAFADRVTAVAPTFGAFFAMGAGCEHWPFEATVPGTRLRPRVPRRSW